MKSPKTVSISKIETEEHAVELKLKLKGSLAKDLQHYRDAYQEEHGQAVDLEVLVSHVLSAYVANDRGFQTWLKAKMRPGAGEKG
jgi:hypothetical protein